MRSRTAGVIISFIILSALLAPGCNQQRTTDSQEGTKNTFADAQTAAAQSLTTFRKLVTKDNYKELGFETPEEVSGAALGQPLKIVFVELDKLRAYQPGSDPAAVLSDMNEVFYPVNVREQTRSSITVRQIEGGKWRASNFGGASLAKQIAQMNPQPSATAPENNAAALLVHVAALNLYFVAHRAENHLMFTSVADVPAYNLRAGKALTAEEVFSLLVPVAKQQPDDLES
jgi:hypothetical protein